MEQLKNLKPYIQKLEKILPFFAIYVGIQCIFSATYGFDISYYSNVFKLIGYLLILHAVTIVFNTFVKD